MGSFSIWHWLVVLLVILLLFGSGKISGLMGDLAKGIKSFRQNMKEDEKDRPRRRRAPFPALPRRSRPRRRGRPPRHRKRTRSLAAARPPERAAPARRRTDRRLADRAPSSWCAPVRAMG
jgi:sec-independent protein translocase protein TatA